MYGGQKWLTFNPEIMVFSNVTIKEDLDFFYQGRVCDNMSVTFGDDAKWDTH